MHCDLGIVETPKFRLVALVLVIVFVGIPFFFPREQWDTFFGLYWSFMHFLVLRFLVFLVRSQFFSSVLMGERVTVFFYNF